MSREPKMSNTTVDLVPGDHFQRVFVIRWKICMGDHHFFNHVTTKVLSGQTVVVAYCTTCYDHYKEYAYEVRDRMYKYSHVHYRDQ